MNDLISIIVPVYNSSQYIYDCIESVLRQTYQNFELILVDDGSQDSSKTICKKMSDKDIRIHFITQSHKGVSAARNRALKNAKGKFLFFLDSDDFIHPCLLEVLYTILNESHSSLAATEYRLPENASLTSFVNDTLSLQYVNDYIHIDNLSAIDLFVQGYMNLLYGTGGIMIRRTEMPFLLFDETLPNGEDTKFVYQILLRGADIVLFHKPWYFYRKYEDSSSKIRTIKSCQSMYKCECYIRDNEVKSQRINNAILKEQILLNRIMKWYIDGKNNHDMYLCSHLKKTAAREWSSDLFLLTSPYIRLRFFLIFNCVPLYHLFILFSKLVSILLHCSIFQ